MLCRVISGDLNSVLNILDEIENLGSLKTITFKDTGLHIKEKDHLIIISFEFYEILNESIK